MKKPLLVCSLIASAILISSCGKESEFKSAINKSLDEHYNCLHITSATSASIDNQVFKKYVEANDFIITKDEQNGKLEDNQWTKTTVNQLEALTKAGLLNKTTAKEPMVNNWSMDKTPIPNAFVIIDMYNLTTAGKQTVIDGKGDTIVSAGKNKNTFCYAHRQVDSVLNFTEHDMAGQNVAQIKYSYKYVDIADWVNKSEIKTAFPEIDTSLNNTDKTSTIMLMKTNNGWQTNL